LGSGGNVGPGIPNNTGAGSNICFAKVAINGISWMSLTNFNFAFAGGLEPFSQVPTFSTLGTLSGNAYLDVPSSFPGYAQPGG
jgi:hypothetical protein